MPDPCFQKGAGSIFPPGLPMNSNVRRARVDIEFLVPGPVILYGRFNIQPSVSILLIEAPGLSISILGAPQLILTLQVPRFMVQCCIFNVAHSIVYCRKWWKVAVDLVHTFRHQYRIKAGLWVWVQGGVVWHCVRQPSRLSTNQACWPNVPQLRWDSGTRRMPLPVATPVAILPPRMAGQFERSAALRNTSGLQHNGPVYPHTVAGSNIAYRSAAPHCMSVNW